MFHLIGIIQNHADENLRVFYPFASPPMPKCCLSWFPHWLLTGFCIPSYLNTFFSLGDFFNVDSLFNSGTEPPRDEVDVKDDFLLKLEQKIS